VSRNSSNGHWPYRLRFAFVKGNEARRFPPMSPVEAQRHNDAAWASLIAGWLVEAWREGAALEVTDCRPGE
jgi:hypothetical protein